MLNGIILSEYCLTYFFHVHLCKIRLASENLCFYWFTIDAERLPKQDMVKFGNCRKCQKSTDFTQIHPFLALLRMLLRKRHELFFMSQTWRRPSDILAVMLKDNLLSMNQTLCKLESLLKKLLAPKTMIDMIDIN